MLANIIRTFQNMIETHVSDNMNTQIPGTIVSYDAAKNRAVVKPSLPKSLASDESLEAPNIVEVPIVWTTSSGGKSGLTMPVKAGDGVMLAFQQRSLEGWLSGNNEKPDDPRQFDLSDCVALIGCAATGVSADPTDTVLKFDGSELRMKPDHTISISNSASSITMDPEGNIHIKAKSIIIDSGGMEAGVILDGHNMTLKADTIRVDTPAKDFVLETHKHTGVRSGSETTQEPLAS